MKLFSNQILKLKLNNAQQASAHRSVSKSEVLLISGVIPIGYRQARERGCGKLKTFTERQ